ncbi:MAG: hypothetical protein FWD04_10045, partial [Conexibacteraceae bacterium]|nr:hypothetical protein [Conexibacteraceae bacterium]
SAPPQSARSEPPADDWRAGGRPPFRKGRFVTAACILFVIGALYLTDGLGAAITGVVLGAATYAWVGYLLARIFR